ncbi:MAG: c-type cytochrome [Chloroflexi bacterium]|nr:c-type cytochrome [Chloroflexota bacterium]
MRKTYVIIFALGLFFMLVLSACSGGSPSVEVQTKKADAAPAVETESMTNDAPVESNDHAEERDGEGQEHDEASEDHAGGSSDVPADAAAVPNPIDANDESIALGRDIYAANCAACHGDSGQGDGPAAAAFDPPPANLHEDHVQVLSDGALFYIIQNGVEGTGMPAWGETLDEEQIWHVVNFIRTYGD